MHEVICVESISRKGEISSEDRYLKLETYSRIGVNQNYPQVLTSDLDLDLNHSMDISKRLSL